MNQVQAAFIGSGGGGGSGTLNFRGQSYPFAVGGLGIGGIGASTINAQGEVYGLNNVADFPGAARARPIRLRVWQQKRGRPVAQEREGCRDAPEGQADRPDA